MKAIPVLLLLALAVWFWQISLKGREYAIRQCKSVCRDLDMQLLDQTVSLSGIRLGMTANHDFMLIRRYRFETSCDGLDRYNGYMVLHGIELQYVEVEQPGGKIIIDKTSHLH
jgi:hypothetical protein